MIPGYDRPSVNRQVIGSSPIAGASWSSRRQPSHLRQRRKRGSPHGAGSARADQDPHKIPTTGAQRGRTARRAGEGRPHGTRQGPRERDRTRGHPGRRPGDRAGVRDHGVPGPSRSRAAGGRSGTRTASGSSARRHPRRSWPPRWRRSPSGWKPTRPIMTLRGADLIAYYLSPDRLPVQRQWSRKHAHTQRRLCERFAAPVIVAIVCQDITTEHMLEDHRSPLDRSAVNITSCECGVCWTWRAPSEHAGPRLDAPGGTCQVK